MGPIPPEVEAQLPPMPADFAPELLDNGKHVSWRGRVTITAPGRATPLLVEYGLPKSDPDAREKVRSAVWTIAALAALGRDDLLGFASVDRHKR